MKLQIELLLTAVVLSIGVTAYAGSTGQGTAKQSSTAVSSIGQRPDPSSTPAEKQSDEIRLGAHIFDETPKYAAAYVGNQLTCQNCHMQGGTAPNSAPMTGLTEMFPQYNKRAGHVVSLGQRFQECFVRSEDGTPPPLDSPVTQALLAYIGSLSKGQTRQEVVAKHGLVKLPPMTGDATRGAAIYEQQCAVCHRSDGAGVAPVFPPLWGPGAYNDGAGMDKVYKMAAFVIKNMPQNRPDTLTAQQAYDVAAYVHSKPHTKFNTAYSKY